MAKNNLLKNILMISGIVVASAATVSLAKNLIKNNRKDAVVEFYSKDTLYGSDYMQPFTSISKGAKYSVFYDKENGTDEEKNLRKPSSDGKWTARVDITESTLYKAGSFKKEFNYVNTSSEKIKGYFDISSDSWGGDSNGTSVNCSADNVVINDEAVELTIDKDNETSACLDSKFTMFDGRFKIMFKTDLSDYGTFAFWLTGVQNEQNTKDEITIELCSDNKVIFGHAVGDDYTSTEEKIDINYADGYWHSLEINYNHATPEANVKLDDQVIYTFEGTLPSVEYVKPHIGLLYPINPTWAGKKTNKVNKAWVANYEVYKVDGDAQ